MAKQKTITIFDAFKMGVLSFKNGLPEVPEISLGFLQRREFKRGWDSSYLINQKHVKRKENKKSHRRKPSPVQI